MINFNELLSAVKTYGTSYSIANDGTKRPLYQYVSVYLKDGDDILQTWTLQWRDKKNNGDFMDYLLYIDSTTYYVSCDGFRLVKSNRTYWRYDEASALKALRNIAKKATKFVAQH